VGDYLNSNSILTGPELMQSMSDMVTVLSKDNEAYDIARGRLADFSYCQSTGEAVDGLKMQMDDLCLVIDSLKSANESDICDIEAAVAYCMSVGRIYGQDVIDGENAALAAEDFDNRMGDWWTQAADDAEWYEFLYEALCRNKARSYYNAAKSDRELYNEWKAKREKYNTTYEKTAQFVTASNDLRSAAIEFMNTLLTTFTGNSYDSSLGEACRSKLLQENISRVITYSDDGSANINWKELNKIIRKDADKITVSEYEALTVAYLNMSDAQLELFLEALMGEPKSVNYNWLEELIGSSSYGGASFQKKDYIEWTINNEKVSQIMARLSCQEDAYLILECELDAYGLTEEAISICERRCTLLQRYVLLDEMLNVNTFRTAKDESEADILSITTVDGKYVVKFKQYGDILNGPTHCFHTLAEGTIVIGETQLSSSSPYEQLNYIQGGMISRFGVPTGSNLVISGCKFSAEETTSLVVDHQLDVLQEAAKSAGKTGLSKGIGIVPVVGDLIAFGLDTWMDYEQRKQDTAYIVQELDKERIQKTLFAWQSPEWKETYKDIPEFCYSATKEEIAKKGYSLVPSKYIEFIDHDLDIDFEKEMARIQKEMKLLLDDEKLSQKELEEAFRGIGYEIK